jgi:hypothetical protein
VELARPLFLLQHVPERVDAVVHAHRLHGVAAAPHAVPVAQLVNLHGEGHGIQAQVHRLVQQPPGRGRAVELHGRLAPHHPQGAQEADDSQVVVGMEVGEEDGVHGEAGAEAHHLPLAALATVEEEQVRIRLHREPGEVAVQRRLCGRGAEKGEPENGHAGAAHD